MSEPTVRPAVVGDAADIHELLLRRAGDLALAVDTLEQEEALYAQLRKTLAWGESWVAEADGRIVGCALVDNIQTGRHWGENETLELRHAAGEALDALVGRLIERRTPILAAVKDANRTGLAAILGKFDFHEIEAHTGERRFRREP